MRTDAPVRIANQIGTFFDAMPDRAEAVEGIALHIRRFWEPRMRRELLAFVHASGGANTGLSMTVADTISRHRAALGQERGRQKAAAALPRAPRADTFHQICLASASALHWLQPQNSRSPADLHASCHRRPALRA